jgi:hypothetical protein
MFMVKRPPSTPATVRRWQNWSRVVDDDVVDGDSMQGERIDEGHRPFPAQIKLYRLGIQDA